MKENKIAIIRPFFQEGYTEWPQYFDTFLISCKYNRDVDFIIPTDDDFPKEYLADNIKIIKTSFADLMKRINAIHNTQMKLSGPHKLGELKPLMGRIFMEELKGYDFWGFCDFDLIFGNIRSFMTDELLDKYDHLMVAGHFQLHRNSEEGRNYYLLEGSDKSRTFRAVVNNLETGMMENSFWDEHHGLPTTLNEKGIPYYRNLRIYADVTRPADKKGKILDLRVKNNTIYQYWNWKCGKLYHVNAIIGKRYPLLYIHFGGERRFGGGIEAGTEVKEFNLYPDGTMTDGSISRAEVLKHSNCFIEVVSQFVERIPDVIKWKLNRNKPF